jgi:hypothetical protein
MRGAPRLGPLGAELVLTHGAQLERITVQLLDVLAHRGFELSAHDHHDPIGPRRDGITDGEVEEDLATRAHVDELLVATESAAESGGHDDEGE